MHTFKVASLLLAIYGAVSNAFPQGNKVIGGEDAPADTYIWQVSLQEKLGVNWYSPFCGGSLISEEYVLTAAHCYLAPSDTFVYVGSLDKENGGTYYSVVEFIQHQDYNSRTIEYDFALVKTSMPVTLGPSVGIVALTDSNTATATYSGDATVTGWGIDYYGIWQTRPQYLQEAILPVRTDAECTDRWGGDYYSSSMLCAGGYGTSACMGDSGGPFVQQTAGAWTLIGVVSWGSSVCSTSSPTVFSKVASVRGWIASETGV